MSENQAPTPFMILCASLGTQVHMALGLLEDPIEKKTMVELPAAKQGIDMLAMLEAKTKGNLDAQEAKFLGDFLMQLRMIFVEVSKQSAAESEEKEAASEEKPDEPDTTTTPTDG